MTSNPIAWSGLVPFEDTSLAVSDTGGTGVPVIYLNGHLATRSHWRRVIAALGGEYRHITYDERARGGSRSSADYSFAAGVRDVGAVLEARAVTGPVILAGWSYGAAIGVQWASEQPDRARGVVCVDGAYPYDYTDEESLDRIRRQFRRLRWVMPLLRPLGLAPRMSVEEQAESNIELLRVVAKFGPVLEGLAIPVRFVVASGANLGGGRDEMEQMRATLEPVIAVNPNIQSVRVPSNHTRVLRNDFAVVADEVRSVAVAGLGPSRS